MRALPRCVQDGVEVVTDASQLQKGGRFKWVPFGAGRHRCIGFEFAQVQIRSIWSVLLRNYEFWLPDGASHACFIGYGRGGGRGEEKVYGNDGSF